MVYYRQCLLAQEGRQQVVWIPEALAVKGKKIVIKGEEGNWDVQIAYPSRLTDAYLREHERDYLTQRQASDI